MRRFWQCRRILLGYGLCALMAISLSGCLALAVGGVAAGSAAAGYAYYNGNVPLDYEAEFDATFTATQNALRDVKLPVLRIKHEIPGQIESATPQGDRIIVYLEPVPKTYMSSPNEDSTRVHIRVGWFGDAELADLIFDRIGFHLQKVGKIKLLPPRDSTTDQVRGSLPTDPRVQQPKVTLEPPLARARETNEPPISRSAIRRTSGDDFHSGLTGK